VLRPFWFIRPYIPSKTESGIVRQQKRIPLGFCDNTTKKKALAAADEYMALINADKLLLQAQVVFGRVIGKFEEGAIPLLASSTRGKYRNYITRFIKPAFETKQMAAVDTQSIQVCDPRPTGHGCSPGARFDVTRSAAGMYSVTGRSLIGIRQTSTISTNDLNRPGQYNISLEPVHYSGKVQESLISVHLWSVMRVILADEQPYRNIKIPGIWGVLRYTARTEAAAC
jgi:hypothetical protein